MSGKPLISVIINCYNSDSFLREAIESALNQTYKNFELIFWDNQSTDQSAEIIKSYSDERIKYFYAPSFTSLGYARNLAVSKSTGKWIAFLDADDSWEANKLEESINCLNNYFKKDQVSLLYTKTKMIDFEGKFIGKYTRVDSGRILKKLLRDGNFIVQSSIMVRKDIFDEVLGINTNLNYCPDYDLSLKITKNYHAIGVDQYLTNYRVHDGSITASKIYENTIEEVDFLMNYYSVNSLEFLTNVFIHINIINKINSLFLKLLIKKNKEKIKLIIKKYFFCIPWLPFSILFIIKNKILIILKNLAS